MGEMVVTEPASDAASQQFIDRFNATGGHLGGSDIDWLRARRLSGAKSFAATGWPTGKTEAWRYTALRSILKTDFDWQKVILPVR